MSHWCELSPGSKRSFSGLITIFFYHKLIESSFFIDFKGPKVDMKRAKITGRYVAAGNKYKIQESRQF